MYDPEDHYITGEKLEKRWDIGYNAIINIIDDGLPAYSPDLTQCIDDSLTRPDPLSQKTQAGIPFSESGT